MSMTNFAEAALLNALLRNTAYSPANAGQTWAGLYTAAPTDAGGGTECSSGGTGYTGYARQTFGATPSTAWSVVSGDPSTATNQNALTFPAVSATPQGIVAIGVFDASAAGNLLARIDISTVTFNNTDVPQIAATGLQVTLN